MKKNRIKVLMLTGSCPPARCGIGDYTNFLCRHMAVPGMDVTILTSSYLGVTEEKKPVRIIPGVSSWKAKNSSSILEMIKKIGPDILHIQYPNLEYKKNFSTNLLPAMMKLSGSNIKIVQTFHEPIRDLTLLGKIRFMLNFPFADGRIFVEKENYDTLPFYLKMFARNERSAFIPIASNIPRIRPDSLTRKKILKRFCIGRDKKVLMTFGFITRVKGYETLLKIIDPGKHAWIHIGAMNKEEKYQVDLVDKANKSGIKINFTGYLSDKDTALYLSASDVVVFPFKEGVTDRHGTFLAAANQGTYIAAFHRFKRGYIKEENAFYCEPGDMEGMKKAVDFEKHARIVRPYVPLWGQVAARHIEFYKKIMAS